MVEQLALFEGKHYTVADANPRSLTVKGMEMTVLRALQLIDAFEALEPGQDWTDVPGPAYRKIIGERYEYPALLSECWERFKRGTLYREVLDLAANLPPASLERKDIADGLQRIRKSQDGRRTRDRSRSPVRHSRGNGSIGRTRRPR
jgi:hypothetical protein